MTRSGDVMDFPDEQRLKETIERLTRENAKLRTQLAVAQQWNPPLDLEQAFRSVRGWQCLTVPLMPDQSTLILISGIRPGNDQEEDGQAAGEVWRHLQTAAAPGGRIGPFARARMPQRLLGYLREQSGRSIIVLNRDLRRGQVSRAARMLRESAKRGRPTTRLLELSAIPLLSLCTLFHGDIAKSAVGISAAAAAPAVTIILPAAVASAIGPNNLDTQTITLRQHPPSHTRSVDVPPPTWPPGPVSTHGKNPLR
ncbi:hypothetical protein [Actinomadura chokoriensis]|uniref:Uncharacterized protein n=1 Tax=Actinomadura chokoriensis TaxID=454156 RepID=A0ABV4QR50_9ACTN